MAKKSTILMRRGLKQDLPELNIGEIGFCVDTKEVYIGSEDGNVLINNYEGGGVSELIIKTTHANLVDLRDNGELIPGIWYRITDYIYGHGHQFDILLLATSENTLSQEGRAIKHEGDTYFANSNLEKWKVWYDIDSKGEIKNDFGYDMFYIGKKDIDGKNWFLFQYFDEYGFAYDGINNNANSIFLYDKASETIDYNNNYADYEGGNCYAVVSEAGLITRLIDEKNNDLPLDFKNEIIRRYVDGYDFSLDDNGGTLTDCYVFYDKVNDNDSSIYSAEISNNKIIGGYNFIFVGNNFYANTIGDDFNYNTIGYKFYNNTIGYNFYSNTIESDFHSNTIGYKFYNNTIGYNFYSNTIGNNFYSNTIGISVYANTIGDDFNYNTIGISVYANTIGNYFNYNTIGNYVGYITLSVDGTSSSKIQYLYLNSGLFGLSLMNKLDLYFEGLYGRTYPTTFEIVANNNIVASWEATPLTRTGKLKETKTTATWSDI